MAAYYRVGMATLLGMVIGVALGALAGSIPAGVATGVALGVGLDSLLNNRLNDDPGVRRDPKPDNKRAREPGSDDEGAG